MQVKWSVALATLLFCGVQSSALALTVTQANSTSNSFLLIENRMDNDYFIASEKLDPRFSGSNRWTRLKHGNNTRGRGTQYSLGYFSTYHYRGVSTNDSVDVWFEDLPIKRPIIGLRCLINYNNCDKETSAIAPELIDDNGFYGAKIPSSSGVEMTSGVFSDAFYNYLVSLPLDSVLELTANTCRTTDSYNARVGGRCKDQNRGYWYRQTMDITKFGHLTIHNTRLITNIEIDTDGNPSITGPGACEAAVIGGRSGVICKMVDYNYQVSKGGNAGYYFGIYPSINHDGIASDMTGNDVKFSIDGSTFRNWSANGSYFFRMSEVASTNSSGIYMFLSNNFFAKMGVHGLTGTSSAQSLITFTFYNARTPQSGWYDFTPSTSLSVTPIQHTITLSAVDGETSPYREGHVGSDAPSLDFYYFITLTGSRLSDWLLLSTKGDAKYQKMINSKSYCIFHSDDGKTQVPFPSAYSLTMATEEIKEIYSGCQTKGLTNEFLSQANVAKIKWRTMELPGGNYSYQTILRYSIPMNDPISMQTVDGDNWFGNVSASGEIVAVARWNNLP